MQRWLITLWCGFAKSSLLEVFCVYFKGGDWDYSSSFNFSVITLENVAVLRSVCVTLQKYLIIHNPPPVYYLPICNALSLIYVPKSIPTFQHDVDNKFGRLQSPAKVNKVFLFFFFFFNKFGPLCNFKHLAKAECFMKTGVETLKQPTQRSATLRALFRLWGVIITFTHMDIYLCSIFM